MHEFYKQTELLMATPKTCCNSLRYNNKENAKPNEIMSRFKTIKATDLTTMNESSGQMEVFSAIPKPTFNSLQYDHVLNAKVQF